MPWKTNAQGGLAQCEHDVTGKTDGRVIIIMPTGNKVSIYRSKMGMRHG